MRWHHASCPLSDGWHEVSHDDVVVVGIGAMHRTVYGYFLLMRLGLSGLKLNGFQDTLRRPVALYPDQEKLCTYPD